MYYNFGMFKIVIQSETSYVGNYVDNTAHPEV